MSEPFDVFLSHNSRDKPTVRQLAQALKQRGLQVWLDEEQLVPGRPWQEALEEIIETVPATAVLVGRDGLGPWEDREMRACLSEFVNRKLPVIPVLLPDAPTKPKLPLFLRAFTWVDLRDGLTDEGLDKLVWGITDVHAGGSSSRAKDDEGDGRDPWIVKTLDHLKQAGPLRDRLRTANNPTVAVVEGRIDDWPNYLADDVFLDPWPALEDIPPEATTLSPTRYGENEDAFWSALHNQRVPASRQSTGRERETVRAWLRQHDRHLFFVSCSIEENRWRLHRLIRAAQGFLAELSRCEPHMHLLMLIVCQPSENSPPWWWPLCRRYLKRIPDVLWLEPLRPLRRPDLDDWYNGFTNEIMRLLHRDRLRNELLGLFVENHTDVRYQLVRKRLLDDRALEKARIRR